MVDLQETPAVPPTDPGGDERIGWNIAGTLLVAIGWGAAVFLNLLLHATAPVAGRVLGPIVVFPHPGMFAWITVGIGVFTGAVGAGLLWIARRSPSGPAVLPGYPY